jgi:NADH-quinone oxidoreductase subunit L
MMPTATLLTLALAVLLLPLAGFLLLIFAGRRLPRRGDLIETGLLVLALLFSVVILVVKLTQYPGETLRLVIPWVAFPEVGGIGPVNIAVGVAVDNLAAIMLFVVTLISALVHVFSIGYMQGDVRYGRYFAFLGLFSFSMLVIVLADNLLLLYVGWELVGLSSYLLIGHWYEKKSASDAAMKAFIVNRIGDLGFFTGIMTLFATFHTFGLEEIFAGVAAGTMPFGSETWLTAAGILIFCGAVGKSAQFPLHVWLPDAMEGPTPVSALIHAATMVAAGVYLVARTYPLFTADALMVIAYTGAITAFIAATIAVVQNDIKKVLAYSTISQLGYMVMGLGVGAFAAGFFHLVTHAMFKAGLFLGSGSVIHAMHHALHEAHDHHTDPQDIRHMGGLKGRMPVTYATFLIYTLAISGVPLMSGFMSKDAILAGTLAYAGLSGHVLIPIIGFFVAGLTAFYMFRLVILAFHGEHREPSRTRALHESPLVMTVPLMILAVMSFFFMFGMNPLDASTTWVEQSLPRPETATPAALAPAGTEAFAEAMHHAHTPAMMLSLTVAGLGILLAFVVYAWKKISADAVTKALAPVHAFLLRKWWFDELYMGVVVGGTLAWTQALRWFDNTIIDGAVNGAGWITRGVSFIGGKFDDVVIDGLVNLTAYLAGFGGLVLRKFQTGSVQTYLVFVVAGVMVLYFIFRAI